MQKAFGALKEMNVERFELVCKRDAVLTYRSFYLFL